MSPRKIPRRRQVANSRCLRIDRLEDRTAPAVVAWDGGGGDFNWGTPQNWDTDVLPGLADDVTVDVVGDITVTHSTGTDTINSLTCAENLTISGGTLNINAASSVQGTLSIAGGTFRVNAAFVVAGPASWQGGTIAGTGDFDANGGLNISTTANKFLQGKLLRLGGGGTWSGGELV